MLEYICLLTCALTVLDVFIYIALSRKDYRRQALFWALEFAGAFLCSGPGGGDRGLAPKGDGAGG